MDVVEQFRTIMAGYLRDGPDVVTEHATEDCVFEEYRLAPGATIWHGRDGVRALWRRWQEDFEGFGFEPTGEPHAIAPEVVAIPVRVRGRGRASGLEANWNLLMITRLRGGLIARSFFADTVEEARERL